MTAKVIYRGPVDREPTSVNLPVAGAYLPGELVVSNGSTLTRAVAANADEQLLVLSNRDFSGQTVGTAYASGDTGIAYRTRPDDEYNVRFAAGTYTKGQALTVDADGRMAAAAAGDPVFAYYDGAGLALAAGDLDDVVIANRVAML